VVDLSPDQAEAIQIAHDLVDLGVPIFSAYADTLKGDFLYPEDWQSKRPAHAAVERWRPGMALAMVTGVVHDVIDVDPRNGGDEGWAELEAAGAVPLIWGEAATPSAGRHLLVARTHIRKTKPAKGIDLQAGDDRGEGRGFVFIAPTVRVSKHGPNEGQPVAYRWVSAPVAPVDGPDEGMANLLAHVELAKKPRRPATRAAKATAPDDDADAFADMGGDEWTPEAADRVIAGQIEAVTRAREGEVNSALGGAARLLGRFVAGGYLDEDEATQRLLDALDAGGVHSDRWNVANGKTWTAATVIGAGLANGGEEPWEVASESSPLSHSAQPSHQAGPAGSVGVTQAASHQGPASPSPAPTAKSGGVPRLQITSAADMAYWLQSVLGSGQLSGYFLRNGQVVHTPRVDELGYVPAKVDEDENGPAQIQPVSAATLTAKIQYAFSCYAIKRDKETKEERESPALFPLEAARRATDAPEAMAMLRGLAGITHTPMVRADGSILEAPGYDPATRYLFLPGPGVKVAKVPEVPTPAEVEKAVALLDYMTAGFPWEGKDDRANYYGLLLTPLLRALAPPSYKAFFVGAHQPGSGKTLLADVARILHGGIFRSEFPQDEKEVKSMTTSLLATTSAPVVHIDNIGGVLRSSYLAGLLTARGEMQERELGKSSNLAFTNDRLWVFTGNNPSLGGDLVRRTIMVMIDPNMANPETRQFEIRDLPAWTEAHRNEILHALLTMVRAWVAAGRPLADRAQSDSFATWEATVAGILNVCGVPGEFDQMSGKKAAAGGDDDGLSQVLERIYEKHTDQDWTVQMVLEAGNDEWGIGDLDWLPSPVLDKMARSLASGKKTMGYWLRNRLGRWVSGSDGHSYVIREAGKRHGSALWRIERTP
jgi:hypothetical protein